MSQAVECSLNGKGAPELQVSFKFSVLDCDLYPRAMEGAVQDSALRRISAHFEFSVKRGDRENSLHSKGESSYLSTASCRTIGDPSILNGVAYKGDPNTNPSMQQDHVGSCETCTTRGCKEIHQASLHDWHMIDRSEGDGYVDADLEFVANDLAACSLHLEESVTSFDREPFEIVDGVVESELVDGRVVKAWKDMMLMEEDCGLQGYVLPDHGTP